jgi:hypothetical protein
LLPAELFLAGIDHPSSFVEPRNITSTPNSRAGDLVHTGAVNERDKTGNHTHRGNDRVPGHPTMQNKRSLAMPFRHPSTLLVAIVCLIAAAPARAAPRDRVFVASYGTDSGNTTCSFLQPCRTFQNAVNNVAAGGEVTAIDSAGFGQISITQSVTITSPPGIEAGVVAPANQDTIAISGSNLTVVLRGLTLEGNAISNNGVNFSIGGGELQIVGCKIHNFASSGILAMPTGGTLSLLVTDTVISDNGYGLTLFPNSGGAAIKAALDGVTINNNDYGIGTAANVSPIELLISHGHIDNNLNNGLIMVGGPSTTSTAVLDYVTFNENQGIDLTGYSTVWMSHVTQTTAPGFTNTFGVSASNSNNVAFSDGTNHLMGGLGGGITLQSWGSQ